MSIGIDDTFKFGKHKGKTFAEVMLISDGPGWCAWLRSEKKKTSGVTGFSKEANDVIDEAIRNDRYLRSKFQIENMTPTDLEKAIKRQVDAAAKAAAEEERAVAVRDLAYAGQWGAW
ncbi:MAG: hypothetical protein FWF12_00070 [Betaproteobacteria bacterium]|nr:hypothetical protein [Betaproteobacteria bacterium]